MPKANISIKIILQIVYSLLLISYQHCRGEKETADSNTHFMYVVSTTMMWLIFTQI